MLSSGNGLHTDTENSLQSIQPKPVAVVYNASRAGLTDEQRALLSHSFRRLFCPLMIQVGGPVDLISDSSAGRKVWVVSDTKGASQSPQIEGWSAQLPIANNSADAILLHHALDVTRHPQVLREAVRVLRPGGTLLVLGFNPAGARGLARQY